MGQPYRLIAIDVDGTLVNTEGKLPDENRVALHRAHEAGFKICLCTGRTVSEARPVIDELGLDSDVGIFVFGAIVSELPSGRTLVRSTISPDVADRLVTFFLDHDLPVLALYDVTEAGLDYRYLLAERASPGAAEGLERWRQMAPARLVHVRQWERWDHQPVRIGVVVDPDQAPNLRASLRAAFTEDEMICNSIFAPNYGLHVVECFAPHVSKWHGIMQVLDQLGIQGHQVAAIGDDVNDLEMIRHAGLGIAMGNAIDAVKQAADRHVPSNNDHGVAVAIDQLLQ
jgi:Cof subfamily protein (haloacid dehalogenase superfamily)